jgi:hypothetical protein
MLSLSCCAAGVLLRKFLPIPTNSRVLLRKDFKSKVLRRDFRSNVLKNCKGVRP